MCHLHPAACIHPVPWSCFNTGARGSFWSFLGLLIQRDHKYYFLGVRKVAPQCCWLLILGAHRAPLSLLHAGALFCRTNSSSLPGSWLCHGPVLSNFLVQSSGNGGLALTDRARQAVGLSFVPPSAQRLLSWEVCPWGTQPAVGLGGKKDPAT